MNKVNFDSFKRIHASEELIEKALAIPATVEKAPAVIPWYRQSRAIAAAASIVLVVLAGFSVYFLFGNKKPPIRSTDTPQTSTIPSPEVTDEPTKPDSTSAVTSTSASEGQGSFTDRLKQGSTTQPTIATTFPFGSAETMPIQQPSQPPASTERDAVEPATSSASQSILLTDSPTVWTEPATVPIQNPTDETWKPAQATEPIENSDLILTGRIHTSNEDYHGTVYCRIYDWEQDAYLGDANPLASTHLAQVTVSDSGYVWIAYRPAEHGIVPTGAYYYYFYNEVGEVFE